MTNGYPTPDFPPDPTVGAGAEALIPELATVEFAPEVNDAIARLREVDDETLFLAHARSVEEWRDFNRNLTPEQRNSTGAEREALLARDRFLLNRGSAVTDVLLERGLLRWGVDNFNLDREMAEKSRQDTDTTA